MKNYLHACLTIVNKNYMLQCREMQLIAFHYSSLHVTVPRFRHSAQSGKERLMYVGNAAENVALLIIIASVSFHLGPPTFTKGKKRNQRNISTSKE